MVRINSNDKIFFGDKPRQDDGEMLRVGKDFLKSARNNARMIAFQADRGTSYGAYLHMQALLRQIYEEVWNEKAQELYGKSLEELSTDEKSQILRLVPFAIFETDMKG